MSERWTGILIRVAIIAVLLLGLPASHLIAEYVDPADREDDRSQAYYHFLLAKGYEFEHLYEEAIAELLEALKHDRDSSSIRYQLARLYERLGRETESLEEARRAVDQDPANLAARLFLGRLYFKQGMRSDADRGPLLALAEVQYRKVLELKPQEVEARLDLAHIYRTTERDEEALAVLEGQLADAPFDERILFAVGNIHWTRRNWEKALEQYRKILEVDPDSIRALLDVADTYSNMSQPDKALGYYLKALAQNPTSFNILRQVAMSYEDLHRLDDAERYYLEALRLKSDSLEVLDSLGNVAFMKRDFNTAADRYLRVLEEEPERMITRFNLGRSYKNLNKPSLALLHLESLRQRLSGKEINAGEEEEIQHFSQLVLEQLSDLYVELEQFEQALIVLREASQAAAGKSLEIRLNIARVEHLSGDSGAALITLEDSARDLGDDPEIRLLRGELLLEIDRKDQARAQFRALESEALNVGSGAELWKRLVAIYLRNRFYDDAERLLTALLATEEGKSAQGYYYLSRARFENGNYPGALETVLEARALYPDDLDFLLMEGEIHLAGGDEERCRTLLEALLAKEDSAAETYLQVAILYQRSERFELAAGILEQALKRFPKELELLFQLGANLERMGRLAEAETRFRTVLSLDPDHAPTLNYLGYMLADRGERLEEAIELIGRALRQDPRNGAYLDSMGWALYKAGMLEQAGEFLLDAVRLMPEDPVIHDHLADHQRALGNRAEAIRHWELALELGTETAAEIESKMETLNDSPAQAVPSPEGSGGEPSGGRGEEQQDEGGQASPAAELPTDGPEDR